MTVPWRLDDAGMNDLLARAFVRPIKKAPTWGRGLVLVQGGSARAYESDDGGAVPDEESIRVWSSSGGLKLSRKVNTIEVKKMAASISAVATIRPPAMLPMSMASMPVTMARAMPETMNTPIQQTPNTR